ncbi:hypothetical protein FRX31_033543 [Thalictrum thalictroides]|uniref:Uncharacterized protein n=1 Tax=Thalictrum thalictroides TaxID=46969 RepID=A0A7J6UW90_THATH|nr:hypothetical protein FRX31_033543 [Thalictrum thalictroides]
MLGVIKDVNELLTKWMLKTKVVTLKKSCGETVSNLVTRLTLIRGCMDLLFTQIALCPSNSLLVHGMLILMIANMVSKVNYVMTLVELGGKLREEYGLLYREKYAVTSTNASCSGWFIWRSLLEACDVAGIYLFGEVLMAVRGRKLDHC